ncbi:hypothetical protein [Nakamurella deserti]|uniref:hypothetical protein n=1 Tax=Nakamurella deserti TaxID=2164074 RepID=UPI000DBE416C|nr:hypothetical protein [Nakamurella deserti]
MFDNDSADFPDWPEFEGSPPVGSRTSAVARVVAVQPEARSASRPAAVRAPADRLQVVAELRRRLADTAPPPAAPPSDRDAVPVLGAGGPAGLVGSVVGPLPGGVVPMLSPLDTLLPEGGLPRGSVVSLQPEDGATGLTSLLFTLLAGPSKPWSALVGFGDLGLAAAAELGVDLTRLVLVPDPGVDVLQILSVLIDGVDVIAVSVPKGPIGSPSRQRVLAGRLRQRGAVLLAVGPWPGADLSLTVATAGWRGLGAGHGRLRDRELVVRLTGRRRGGQVPEVRMLLAGSRLDDRVLVQAAPVAAERRATGTGTYLPVADAG